MWNIFRDVSAGEWKTTDKKKGKGNFVAETRQIQEKSKEDFRKEFLELVRRGINTGMTEEELMTLVQKGYEEEQR